MPAFCSVYQCAMRGERDKVSFFRFPAILTNSGENKNNLSKQRREAWIKALRRGPLSETQLRNGRICSRHFISGKPALLEDTFHPDWIPNQNMGVESGTLPGPSAVTGHERLVKRKRLHEEEPQETPYEQLESRVCNISDRQVHENNNSVSVSAQTKLSVENLCSVFKELEFCNSKIYTLETKLNSLELNKESFIDDDIKTKYFTGFPSAKMLFIICDSVSSQVPCHHDNVLSKFQMLLLTFMKLRLNLPFKYLSYRFSVGLTTVSETFFRCIDVLYEKYKYFIYWPERKALQKNVPLCFQESFGEKVAVIIDCFEVSTETLSQTQNTAGCRSNYKHHQTVKFLIGITPQGTISFISEAWGGQTSDKYLIENCGFLDLILPGDIILADRGFLMEGSVKTWGAELKIPAFTRGESQLHPVDLENTRAMATVQNHVEKVIGLLKKKYQIFQQTIPQSMLSKTRDASAALDKIIVICSAFLNLCDSQIPLS